MKSRYKVTVLQKLKDIQTNYPDIYIKWVDDEQKISKGEILPLKEAKIKYGDCVVKGTEELPSGLVTIVYLEGEVNEFQA